MANDICGFIYEHWSGYKEICVSISGYCDIVGHHEWRAYVDWTTDTYTLDWLREQANANRALSSAMGFLREIGVVRGPWGRKNALPRTNLDPTSIPAGYLAEVALGWDAEGQSSPVDFVAALAFEVNGTTENDMVGEILSSLGREAREHVEA